MTETMISKKITHQCKYCGDCNHEWHEVYYGDKATLKKVERTYITWCKQSKKYVLLNK